MACETDDLVPEPNPHWVNSSRDRRWYIAFEFHIYFFMSCFGLLALYALISMIFHGKALFKKRFYMIINILLLLLGVIRVCFLLIDPYESANALQRYGNETNIPVVITRLLHGLGYPCLTSSFTFIFAAILNCVNIKASSSKKLQHPAVISTIIIIHFAIVISADTTVAYCGGMKSLLIVCQSFFIIWGVVICISYLICGYRILAFTHSNQKTLREISATDSVTKSNKCKNWYCCRLPTTKVTPLSTATKTRPICTSVRRVMKITIFSSCLGLVCVILNTCSLFGVYGVLAPPHFPAPWPWLLYQSLFRMAELAMAAIMAYTTTRPGSKKSKSKVIVVTTK